VKRVVIGGGGVAALEGALALRELAEEGVELVLLTPAERFVYRPMAVTEPFDLQAPYDFPLVDIARDVGARLVSERLVSVDPDIRLARTDGSNDIPYDALVLACGAQMRAGLEGAYTFEPGHGPRLIAGLLQDLDSRSVRSVAFAMPTGPTWALPLYELALLTAHHVAKHQLADVALTLITPEEAPLGIFGQDAATMAAGLLAENGISLQTGKHSLSFENGVVRLGPEGLVEADRVVTLPRLAGTQIDGIPQTADLFVWTDAYGRVRDLRDVYAAGDITAFPVKQGGIAADQAVAAAQHIAAAAGAPVEPEPFDPVLHGLLLTGSTPRFLRTPLAGGRGPESEVASEPLWWPPGKISGHYLPNYLARRQSRA
jgi:sulfide:quinone oxidoreductase